MNNSNVSWLQCSTLTMYHQIMLCAQLYKQRRIKRNTPRRRNCMNSHGEPTKINKKQTRRTTLTNHNDNTQQQQQQQQATTQAAITTTRRTTAAQRFSRISVDLNKVACTPCSKAAGSKSVHKKKMKKSIWPYCSRCSIFWAHRFLDL